MGGRLVANGKQFQSRIEYSAKLLILPSIKEKDIFRQGRAQKCCCSCLIALEDTGVQDPQSEEAHGERERQRTRGKMANWILSGDEEGLR
jgi:hypothetical protein